MIDLRILRYREGHPVDGIVEKLQWRRQTQPEGFVEQWTEWTDIPIVNEGMPWLNSGIDEAAEFCVDVRKNETGDEKYFDRVLK